MSLKVHINLILFYFTLLNQILIFGQINPNNIVIARDDYGVPHIFGKTDAEVAYGLAWAHAEDDFETIQKSYLAGNGILSKLLGIRGAGADFVTQFIGSKEIVDQFYETKISSEYKKILEAYSQGINRYAELNPEKVLLPELFPITPKKMLRYGQLQLFISSEGDYWINKVLNNDLSYRVVDQSNNLYSDDQTRGSNTFGFNSSRTKDGNTYFAINTHQPLDGPVSWYEAHLHSEEGTNIIGALFAGSPHVLSGANENLAWAHTVNRPDKTDVFVLEMHPKIKHKYRVDDSYYELEKHKAEVIIKIFGIPIKIKKKYYESIYGPTLKNKLGYFSIRTPALFEIRSLEQWWRMNKAKSFTEFYNILKMKTLPGYNIGYADKNDTIFYMSNGLIPIRAKGYDWKNIVPGNTKETLWTETYDIEELPQVLQPNSGYFYNANHSPFFSTSNNENPKKEDFSTDMGFETFNNNRSTRLYSLIEEKPTLDYNDFKRIKYDNTLPKPLKYSWMDINALFNINPEKYPEVSNILKQIQEWNLKADADSYGAGAYAIFYSKLGKYYRVLPEPKVFPKTFIINALKETKSHMLKYFGKEKVKLGEFQKLVRGSKEIPIFGLRDIITAMASVPYKDGKARVTAGESYIELVKFTKSGTEIESIISYGSSDNPNSPHYDDQMEEYASFKTKKMTLDKEEVLLNAKVIYSPK
ncbi:MAG: penicillin amidase [Flavobacteriaceae bacterium]|nr:penicillin amidase [Flavobacteriaceae bacterium]|tara:strand:+ start:1846 stop:3942 length:2097 start_codon:yes stop_codon:yes gene_type:complete